MDEEQVPIGTMNNWLWSQQATSSPSQQCGRTWQGSPSQASWSSLLAAWLAPPSRTPGNHKFSQIQLKNHTTVCSMDEWYTCFWRRSLSALAMGSPMSAIVIAPREIIPSLSAQLWKNELNVRSRRIQSRWNKNTFLRSGVYHIHALLNLLSNPAAHRQMSQVRGRKDQQVGCGLCHQDDR